MSNTQSFESKVHNLADDAAKTADRAISNTKRVADNAADTMSDALDDLKQGSAGVANSLAAQIDDLAHRAVALARQAGSGVRKQAELTGERTVGYVKDEPVKAMLIAAATGAALAALLGILSRSRRD